MREELTEPQHWRARSERASQRNNSWASRRRTHKREELAIDAVDAALELVADEPETAPSETNQPLTSPEVISSLSKHLEQLEQQRHEIQKLLDQAQGL